MIINRFIGEKCQANCYVITFEKSAIIIDPCVSYNTIKKYINDFEVLYIFITHGHIDHFYCLEEIKNSTKAKIVCNKNAKEKIEDSRKNYSSIVKRGLKFIYNDDEYIFINENSTIYVEDKKITFLSMPGHSNCSMCILIDNNMFCGDLIFKNSIGRSDLYSSNSFDMVKSLNRLKGLKTDYIIYPGHDDETTLFDEIKNNHYLG